MARRPNQYIELSGPLFEPTLIKGFNDAVSEGIQELADEADDIMASHIIAGGLMYTRRLLLSVDVIYARKGDEPGYAKILPTDVWPKPNRPTGTWISRGVRGGVKMRKPYNIYSRTATRVKQIEKSFIADKIAKALND